METPRLHRRVARLYRHHVDYRRRAALFMWLAFALTIGISRLVTLAIHRHWIANTNLVTGKGLHIHHFVWGIGLLLLVGFLSIMVENARWHPLLGLLFGVGAGLVVDEFALLLNLKDVYWQHEGRSSVEVMCVVFAVLGMYYAADRFLVELSKELRSTARGVLRRSTVDRTAPGGGH